MKETATEGKAIVGVFLLTVSYFLEASIFRRIFSFLASRFLSNILFPRIFTCLSVTYLSIKRTPLYGGQLEEKRKQLSREKRVEMLESSFQYYVSICSLLESSCIAM